MSKVMPASRLGGLVAELMRQMHDFDRGRTIPIIQAAGLTTGQLAALELARRPRTISDVAKKLGLSLPATSQAIARLERARLLRRTERLHDKRQRDVSLTAKGQALLDRIGMARAARFQDSFDDLPPALAHRFSIVLQDVLKALRKGADS
jgi:DNA-binding MarR family transcriptional regulator